jgi:putative copper export protein
MLTPTVTAIRLFLHILAATVWVGGQITLVWILPALKALGPTAPASVARRFNQAAWTAFGVLIVTGIWNVAADASALHNQAWRDALVVKVVVVGISGLSAWMHTRTKSRQGLAVWGGLTGLSALAALFVGVLLAG